MKRNRIAAALAVASAIMLAGGSCVYAMPSISTNNAFSMGIVDITLKNGETGADGAGDSATLDVLPGDDIPWTPYIENGGNPCYVRVRITTTGTDGLDDGNIHGMPDGWTRAADGYWYYTDALDTGETVEVFTSVHIPEDFSQEAEGEEFTVEVCAEAVQKDWFTPDFENETPWGEIKVEECGMDGKYDISTLSVSSPVTLSVEYGGEAEELVADPENFFSNFPALMPGGTYTGTVTLDNGSAHSVGLYFRSENPENNELLEKIQLKIMVSDGNGGNVIYDGPLCGTDISSDRFICTLCGGQSGKLSFTLTVPEDMGNEYALAEGRVNWFFSAYELKKTAVVKTGDKTHAGLALLAGGLAAGCLSVLAGNRKKKGGGRRW